MTADDLHTAILCRCWFAPADEVARLARFVGVFAYVPRTVADRARLVSMIDARLRLGVIHDGRPHYLPGVAA